MVTAVVRRRSAEVGVLFCSARQVVEILTQAGAVAVAIGVASTPDHDGAHQHREHEDGSVVNLPRARTLFVDFADEPARVLSFALNVK